MIKRKYVLGEMITVFPLNTGKVGTIPAAIEVQVEGSLHSGVLVASQDGGISLLDNRGCFETLNLAVHAELMRVERAIEQCEGRLRKLRTARETLQVIYKADGA